MIDRTLPPCRIFASITLVCMLLGGCQQRKQSPLALSIDPPHADIPDALRDHGAPMIRVLLETSQSEITVAIDGPYSIRQNHQQLAKGPMLKRTAVRMAPQGARVMVGNRTFQGGDVLVVPENAATLRVFITSNGLTTSRRYDGYAVIKPSPAGGVDLINIVSIERYLPGVLSKELYPKWKKETYKAQAIAARTYALYEMMTTGHNRPYDVKSTEASQVYGGIDDIQPGSKPYQAVEQTRGVVCTWASPQGPRIFSTYFSSACGGGTIDAYSGLKVKTIPPLRGGVPCNYCDIGGTAYRWGPVIISKSEITQKVVDRFPAYKALGQILTVRIKDRTSEGRPQSVELVGEHGRSAVLDVYKFRLALNGHRIRSTQFDLVDRGSTVRFENGQGFGHAVGMCQWGAEGMARRGASAGQILNFYYPEAPLARAY